ncbi:hypothetical protein [Formosa haliotis]|uniref:hypothetical protein n=1 Tax=Formosa haliotis TaxID=1555194 RepID=UPI0008251D11|nr:hypothetical protein [Formosa haliotis]
MKIKNKLEFDCTGDELTFPTVDINDVPEVGDEIWVNEKQNLTGEALMPDLRLIKYENGIITSIEQLDPTSSKLIHFPIKPETTLRCSKGNKIEIFAMKDSAYKVNNKVLVNGKGNILGNFKVGNILMLINKGTITYISVPKSSKTNSRFTFKRK